VHAEWGCEIAFYFFGEPIIDPNLNLAGTSDVEGCLLWDCGDGEMLAEEMGFSLFGHLGEVVDESGVDGFFGSGPDVLFRQGGVLTAFESRLVDGPGGIKLREVVH